MGIQVALNHLTTYQYDRPVTMFPHTVRLRPAPHCRTPIHAYSLKIEPTDHFINWQQDPFGNYLARLVFTKPTQKFSVEVDLVAEMTVINPFDFFLEESAEKWPFAYDAQHARELIPYLEIREQGPLLLNWLDQIDRRLTGTNDFLVELNSRLQQDIGYQLRMDPGIQTCEETLERRCGSCRDTSWLLVQILRHLGIAARFVSGYSVQLTPDIKPVDGPAGVERDVTDLHAWAEAFLPGAGWVGLDPTSGLFCTEGHIPLACTPDPLSAAAISGATSKCESKMSFHNEVTRIREEPRVTKPYSIDQWEAINALGEEVDREFEAGDVRLTVGGEPTFVAIDDTDADEWNIAALGPTKREYGEELLKRLAARFATGPLLQYTQGKWYPGEPLPRWALACIWRKDHVPVWQDSRWLADTSKSYGANADDASRFLNSLSRRLDVNPQHIMPGFEDVYYYLWKEGTLPTNVDPMKADLKDGLERQRIRRLLEEGIDKVAGFTLPLRPNVAGGNAGWRSGVWALRRGRLFLIPGDSPMGLRLPLNVLPIPEEDEPSDHEERCLFEPRPELGDYFGEVARRFSSYAPASTNDLIREQVIDDSPETESSVIRTAICVEPREGKLHVFLPPISHLEDFLDLIASIESTAADLKMPVVIEGYSPPRDHRLETLQVTPDPGVIEVNMHPVQSWPDFVRNTEILYEEARQCGLGAEKFMMDGRHTGTGGGNHITFGGPTPADSPLLRRPDLLQSLVTFWQHHPSLSYLFSGMFVGPTSQMPRIDEARHDALYELEVAFQQMPRHGAPFPWLVDRLLRHLLVDLTGNTHRAEFCIDKLYSPDSLSGRQGLLEMRAFEMPPHYQMSAAQMLLVRSLFARFWKQPYERPLVRWGTELHDRFVLPHYVAEDLKDVIADLNRNGYPVDQAWFDPFLEFRFPTCGIVNIRDLQVELRTAIEPWHVLGEETHTGGTSRYVDSSVERLQVKIDGMTDSRHILLCNGRRVPLRPTGTNGQFVAGIRFRAWQPPSALHPMIPVHAPLVFDVIDDWSGHAIGGCTYHVSHPGGRSHETFPINANAAETRRRERFWPYGHTPGPIVTPRLDTHAETTYTLDLRRAGRH